MGSVDDFDKRNVFGVIGDGRIAFLYQPSVKEAPSAFNRDSGWPLSVLFLINAAGQERSTDKGKGCFCFQVASNFLQGYDFVAPCIFLRHLKPREEPETGPHCRVSFCSALAMR